MKEMPQSARILVVDDELSVRLSLKAVLQGMGYYVETASSGEEALEHLRTSPFHLVLLDLVMEGVGGIEVMREIKSHFPETVIVILTAHATVESAVEALRWGAYDYLLKPCSAEELEKTVREGLRKRWMERRRVEILSRLEEGVRTLHAIAQGEESPPPAREEGSPEVLEIGPLIIDQARYIVTWEGQPLELTSTEFAILSHLAGRAEQVVSCQSLIYEVYGYRCSENEARRVIRPHISRLRAKFEPDPRNPRYLLNVRGRGYKLSLHPASL